MNGKEYILNLIDTPGHVDFSYEVSRALAACEGALLLVDATQGIQAQTISNLYLAIDNDLEIIPVINKIDMDGAMIDEVKDQIIELIGCKPEDILLASGRTGIGVDRNSGGNCRTDTRTQRRSEATLAGPDLRQRVQFVPRNHRVLPHHERQYEEKATK